MTHDRHFAAERLREIAQQIERDGLGIAGDLLFARTDADDLALQEIERLTMRLQSVLDIARRHVIAGLHERANALDETP